jgi:hypothetical protein
MVAILGQISEVHRTIHFHIGTDHVYEDLFRQVFEPLSDGVTWSFISADDYQDQLRNVIDKGAHDQIPGALDRLALNAQNVAVSRPRLLDNGGPMNLNGGGSFYKLNTIQKGCEGHRLVFHLFLPDHLGYLTRSEPDIQPGANKQCSWMSLVKSVTNQLDGSSELLIWSAEGKNFIEKFISTTTGISGSRLDELTKNIILSERIPTPEAEERFARRVGLDVLAVDASFENDMKRIPGLYERAALGFWP